jgi:chromosomal replication initiation ATPase DnaA
MQVRITEELQKELLDALDLANAYTGLEVDHLKNVINGQVDYYFLDERITKIINRVCKATGFSYDILKSKNRSIDIRTARQYAIWRIHKEVYGMGYSLKAIGQLFDRDHSTVLHTVKAINELKDVHDFLFIQINKRYEELESKSA